MAGLGGRMWVGEAVRVEKKKKNEGFDRGMWEKKTPLSTVLKPSKKPSSPDGLVPTLSGESTFPKSLFTFEKSLLF